MTSNRNRKRRNGNNKNHDILGITLVVISAFLLLCIVIKPILGVFSEAIFGVMLGVFGIASYPMLLCTLILGVCFLTHRELRRLSVKNTVCLALSILFALVILQLASTHAFLDGSFSEYIGNTYAAKYSVGGVIMGAIAFALSSLITEIACYIVFSLALIATVLVMTDAIRRIRDAKRNKKASEIPPPAPAPRRSMTSATEAQRVISAMPQPGLFVTTIERNPADIVTETGVASEVAESDKRAVSDYAMSPVVTREEQKRPDKSYGEAHSAARYKLYGDSEEIKKQSAEEFRKSMGYDEAAYPEEGMYGVAEPYVRVNRDAQASLRDKQAQAEQYAAPPVPPPAPQYAEDMPRRVDYEGTPDNLHELYFPPEKHIEFNDEGIETIEDDIGAKLQEHNEARIRQDIEIIEGGRRPQMGFAPPPVFDVRRDDYPLDPVEKIIDASDPQDKAPPPSPARPRITDDAAEPIISDDRFLRTLEEHNQSSARRMPPLETDKFKADDILDAFEIKGRFTAPVHTEELEEEDDDDREDILDGSAAPAVAPQAAPIADASPIVTASAPAVAPPPDPIPEEIIDGLIISDEPAVDLSETHDNVSDLITGEDMSGMYLDADAAAEQVEPIAAKPEKKQRQKSNAPIENQISITEAMHEKAEETVVATEVRKYKKYNYAPPPIDLLKILKKTERSEDELQDNAQKLEKVVSTFLNVDVKVINIVSGPQVTRYELDVPSGTQVKRIEAEACKANIAYELATAGGVRVEAPILGKRAVGIEVPNREKSFVGLREIVESSAFTKSKSPLVFAVGKDIGGANIVCDLEKVPHILIAGQTGSGKSACLNSLIVSLLYKSSPEDLRFILIDPKRVEFTKFRGMPHLLFEKTISEPNEALNALKWAAEEMDRRYTVLTKYSCSKLSEYNNLPEVASGKISKLPHIVVIIDELATLMLSPVSGEIESKISSIAALARAAGIHLIVATQRPSADVITGTIKANLTSRIAFKVGDATNSRIIIDSVGAESLAGNGDMLFYPGENEPMRVQGSYVDGEEVLSVVAYLKEHYECDFDVEAEAFVCATGHGGDGKSGSGEGGSGGSDSLDGLTARIMAHAIKTKQISTSVIQRRFSIGYARAARIVDTMEEGGYIGPSTGNNKPRDVLMTVEQYRELFGHDPDEM